MQTLLYILLSVSIVSAISFIGVFTLAWKKNKLHDLLSSLVALAAGTMMGTAFLHLLPEAAENLDSHELFMMVLASFITFFAIEKFLHWRHCHDDNCSTHTYGRMSLIGDGVHNFLDGLIIAAAYVGGIEVGIATTIAVILHEIPQEIGDFGVLIKSGYTTRRALFLNFLGALTAVAGGVIGFMLAGEIEGFVKILTPFAAGSFLYIAATDLLPQLQEEKHRKKSLQSLAVFLVGVMLMFVLQLLVHEPGH
jgi:zinc and cadmium transporter